MTTTVEPTPSGSSRSKWLVGGAVASVVAVVAAGIFAIVNLSSPTSGGSASADELGYELLQAIENEDVLGVVDLLLPGERDSFRGPLIDVASELTRLEILSGDFDLAELAGLDIVFDRESSIVRPTNVDDIVNVDLRADATVTVDGADLPIGDLFTDNMDDDMVTELRGTRATTTEELDISLTAVADNGRWYFSAFHTVAELARRDFAPAALIPATGVGADGTDTPEAAVDQLLERVEALDLTGLIRTINPGEASALQRYAPLFLEEAEAALAEAPLEWTITDREYRVEGSGDERTVFIDSIAIEGTADGSRFAVATNGSCVTADLDGETFEQCGNGLGNFEEAFDETFEEAPAVSEFFETVTEAFSDIEPVGLELRRYEGSWYVSVLGTASESFLAVLRALDRDELDAIIDTGGEAFAEVFGLAFGDLRLNAFDDQLVFDDQFATEGDLFIADELEELDEALDELEDAFDDGTFDGAEWFVCYEESDLDDAAACFDAFVESGELLPIDLSVEVRFPECGYAAMWTGEIYNLGDDDFIEAATASRACFLEKLDQGEVEAWELPTEITHLECFEGRNWYNIFDDPEYDNRYYECITSSDRTSG